MANPWFRMYNDFIFDERIEFVAFEDQRHFVFVLCMKNLGLLDKEYPQDGMLDRVVAKRLGLSGEAFEKAKERLMAVGLIDENWQPVAWNKRQFISDSDPSNAARQRRHRQRKKQQNDADLDSNVTRNVTVTLLDTDTDTDTEKNPLTPLSGGEVGKEEKPKRRPRIQLKTFMDQCKQSGEKAISDYKPLLDYVEATGLPMDFVQIAWETFKDEFGSGGSNESRLQADWRRHFMNYVKKGYYRLWYAKTDGKDTVYVLTTQGLQAQALIAHKEAA